MDSDSVPSSPSAGFNSGQNAAKRLRIGTPERANEQAQLLAKLDKDKKCSAYVKAVLKFLMDGQQDHTLLVDEISSLREENRALKARIAQLSGPTFQLANQPAPDANRVVNEIDSDCELFERKRALVISGIPESDLSQPVSRAEEDTYRVKCVVNTLGVDAIPVTVYRMGRVGPRPRLLKVIMPSSVHQKRLVERASWLRNSEFRGVWLRASLSKEVRDQQREVRLRNGNSAGTGNQSQGYSVANAFGNPAGAFAAVGGSQTAMTAQTGSTNAGQGNGQ